MTVNYLNKEVIRKETKKSVDRYSYTHFCTVEIVIVGRAMVNRSNLLRSLFIDRKFRESLMTVVNMW